MTRSGFPGRLLRERRELRGVSLKDAHKHTRVPTEYLKALEDANLQALPVPARGEPGHPHDVAAFERVLNSVNPRAERQAELAAAQQEEKQTE